MVHARQTLLVQRRGHGSQLGLLLLALSASCCPTAVTSPNNIVDRVLQLIVERLLLVLLLTPARLPTEQSEAQIYTDKQQRTATTYRWHTDNTEPESLSPSRFKSQEASSVAQKASAPA